MQFEKFVGILTSNVVDSNMLIRCLVLSQEHFLSSPLAGKAQNFLYPGQNCFILTINHWVVGDSCFHVSCCVPLFTKDFTAGAFKLGSLISNWEQMIFLLYKLINSITVGTLTQVSVFEISPSDRNCCFHKSIILGTMSWLQNGWVIMKQNWYDEILFHWKLKTKLLVQFNLTLIIFMLWSFAVLRTEAPWVMDRARLITDLSIIICFPSLSGKCQLPQHNPCFLDVCTQTWETSSISYGKSVDHIFCWVIDTFVQNM